MENKSHGYSGTPLANKLGLKSGFTIAVYHAPENYNNFFDEFPADVQISLDNKVKKDFIHYFAKDSYMLVSDIALLRKEIKENGMIWISWYKKASKIVTDLDENIIRETALANELVDVKVCSINEKWSALKLVIRLKDRKIK